MGGAGRAVCCDTGEADGVCADAKVMCGDATTNGSADARTRNLISMVFLQLDDTESLEPVFSSVCGRRRPGVGDPWGVYPPYLAVNFLFSGWLTRCTLQIIPKVGLTRRGKYPRTSGMLPYLRQKRDDIDAPLFVQEDYCG